MRTQGLLFGSYLLLLYYAFSQGIDIQQQGHAKAVSLVRQKVNDDSHGGKGFSVKPVLQDEEPATAILLHGLGGTGEEWGYISLALSLISLNYVKFVIPSAKERRVTYLRSRMPSWFDIHVFDETASVDKDELLESVERVKDIVKGEMKNGVKQERIFIVGFSQGGALALTSFLRSPYKLGGCVGVATWLPLQKEYPASRSSKIRNKDILMMHGSNDKAVPLAYARESARVLRKIGQNVKFQELEGQPHLIMNPDVLTALEDFISQRAPGTQRYLNTLINDLTDKFSSLTKRLEKVPGV